MLDMGRMSHFESAKPFASLGNLRTLALETYPSIEKHRHRLGKYYILVIMCIKFKSLPVS